MQTRALPSVPVSPPQLGPPATPAGILIADALPLFRQGVAQVLRQAFDTHPLHEVATVAELLRATGEVLPELVILTSSLSPVQSEFESIVGALRKIQPQLAVLVLINPVTTARLTALRLLRQEVNGLLLLAAPPAEVCEAVGRALKRSQYYSEYALALLRGQLHHPSRDRMPEKFSVRQLEVLHLLAADYTNEEIAEHLCTSVRTVEYHRSQMLQKAGARTSLGLVLFAQRQGLLTAAGAPAPPANQPAARP